MQTFEHCALAFILVYSFVEQLEAVTVNPIAHLCPTNKIAPRRKRYDSHPRTFGQFYNLLTPNSPSGLQEEPQQDDSYDCGDIEDYDENDIGSLTQRPIRRQGYQRNYLRKGSSHSHSHRPSNQHQQLLNQHNQHGIKPSNNRPTRPPQAGYFGTNTYTPPKPQQPTDHVKPVSEAGSDPQMIYRPGLVVGAPLLHIVGLPQPQVQDEKPQPSQSSKPNHREPRPYANNAYLPASQSNSNGNKHHRSRKFNSDTGILGSFVDLFF